MAHASTHGARKPPGPTLCSTQKVCLIKVSSEYRKNAQGEKLEPLKLFPLAVFSCAATQEVPVPVRLPACLSVPDFEFRHKIVFTKPLPRQIYCWQEVPVPVRLPACLSVPDFDFKQKIVFTKPMPRQIYCWQYSGLFVKFFMSWSGIPQKFNKIMLL